MTGTFLIGDPAAKTPQGALGRTPVVKGANQTGTQPVEPILFFCAGP